MQQNPFAAQALYVFIGRRYDALKILGWDRNGFAKPSTQDPMRLYGAERLAENRRVKSDFCRTCYCGSATSQAHPKRISRSRAPRGRHLV
jgi:hypothetical protein